MDKWYYTRDDFWSVKAVVGGVSNSQSIQRHVGGIQHTRRFARAGVAGASLRDGEYYAFWIELFLVQQDGQNVESEI